MIPDHEQTPGGGQFDEDDDRHDQAWKGGHEEKVILTLSSGDEVDLSQLPVRVSCNEGDAPMMTPGPAERESLEAVGCEPRSFFPTDSNDKLFKHHEALDKQQDSMRIFDSEREHAS